MSAHIEKPSQSSFPEGFQSLISEFDQHVPNTPGIDPFCSLSDWTVPFFQSFSPPGRPVFYKTDNAGSAAAITMQYAPNLGDIACSLEYSWGFASPYVGAQGPSLLAELLREHLHGHAALLTGIPEDRIPLFATLLGSDHRIFRGEDTVRIHASLQNGIDGFLSRRSSGFRKSLRRALGKCNNAGIEFECEWINSCSYKSHYKRVMDIESRSWKYKEGTGAGTEPMSSFYKFSLSRLAETSRALIVFAKRDGNDLAYIHGGFVGERFRGFQFSFDAEFSELGLGNAIHYRLINELCNKGCSLYDLGMEVEYKLRWGEKDMRTASLIAVPESAGRNRNEAS